MAVTQIVEELAINGGTKTVTGTQGQAKNDNHLDEFMGLAGLFGYSEKTLAAIKKAAQKEKDLPRPHLTRYYNPRPSRVKMLEDYACGLFGSKHALAVNSGTSALNCAYAACSVGPGDEVIVPAYTFFATVAAVVTNKAIPVIAEIDGSLCLDPKDVEKKITPRTKAIVCVHMSGNVCNMDALTALAKKHGLALIEDNAQACGGKYKGQFTGSIGTLGCFSLSTYKITGAGEAGLVLTDDDWLYTRAQNQHDTAACWRPDRFAVEQKPGELFCGQNYRMSELEGAVNHVQLQKTEAQARRYNKNLQTVAAHLDDLGTTRLRPSNDRDGDVGYHLVLLAETAEKAGKILPALQAEGVAAGGRGSKTARDWHIFSYWEHILEQKTATDEGCPFTCPYYKSELPAYSPEMCPTTLDLMGRAIFVSINQWWTKADCLNTAKAINKVCSVLS
jgi:8-amino-3,8-dideoxy-alpha-D-manno-octulosonate transaminase